jgi:hypothetical protein
MANKYARPDAAPVGGKQAHKVVVDGTPKAGVAKLGFLGKGGKPAAGPGSGYSTTIS